MVKSDDPTTRSVSLLDMLVVMLVALATGNDLESLVNYVYDDIGIAAVSTPELIDTTEGSQVAEPVRMISTKITSNSDYPLPFVVFLEIRDVKGITVFLEFHQGTVPSGDRIEVASSWRLPQEQGEYQLRAFAISNFTSPVLLANLNFANATITV